MIPLSKEILFLYNPWWKTKKVSETRIGKERELLSVIKKSLESRQILVISGLRRVGKTTLLYQIINYLLVEKSVSPQQILYFSFEEEKEELLDVLLLYEEMVLKKKLENMEEGEKVYIFLDEIQKLPEWSSKLKRVYDLFPNLKIVCSGSAALSLHRYAKESLAGRAIFYTLEPLSFREYLSFKGIKVDYENLQLYSRELKMALSSYLETGGFPEVLEESAEFINLYFKELLLERVLYKDIPEVFEIEEPELLYALLRILSDSPGFLLDYKTLSKKLSRDWRTLKKYLGFLEYSLLLRKLYNFSTNLLTTERKLRKFYLTVTPLYYILSPYKREQAQFEGKIMEALVINSKKASFFWRSPDKKEVDMVLVREDRKEVLPVEIKMKENLSSRDFSGILSFCKRFKMKRGMVISKDREESVEYRGVKIKIVPLWKYLLFF